MAYQTLVKDREMVIPETKIREDFEKLFSVMSQTNQYPLATQEQLRDVGGYRWHSEDNKNKAGKNLGCAVAEARWGWLAQAEERFYRFLKDYDNDRVEKSISDTFCVYPKAKLFGVTTRAVAPIVINGEEHIWTGQRLTELQSLHRKDLVIPAKCVKRTYDLERNGIGFKDYAIFWPGLSYEASKIALFNEQIESIKGDGRKMASFVKSGMRIVKDAVSSVANSTAAVAGSVAGSVAQAAGSAIDRMSEIRFETPAVQLNDPVLAGIIVGSVPSDRRVFFIEIGRWV
jgi:hypothetical protein